jgi:hypothetical protein
MRQSELRRRLRDAPIPDEHGARERGWRLVRAGFEERRPAARPARTPTRVAIAFAVAALGLVLILTPAGAKVVDAVRDVIRPGDRDARPLTSLPAPGRLLVNSPQGPWVLNADGSQRLLGDYRDATWSPHGYFVAVTAGDQLSAVEPDGTLRWSLRSSGTVADPRWAPSGYRVAYRSGSSMRVVVGDGTGDHLVAARVAPTPAAWRPLPSPESKVSPPVGGENVLALVTRSGRIEVMAASGRVLWRSAPGRMASELDWSADGSRLVALTEQAARVFTADGRLIRTRRLPGGLHATGGEFAPTGLTYAATGTSMTDRGPRGAALVLQLGGAKPATKRLFAGPGGFGGVAWSPDGRWLLLGWRDADEWVFLRPDRPGHVKTAGDISRQFDPGAPGSSEFPTLAGWCCTASGASAR